MIFHLLYTDKNNKFHNEEKEFGSFAEAEIWLVMIESIKWEIGIPDEWLNEIRDNSQQSLF
jgi:hypothetical protein